MVMRERERERERESKNRAKIGYFRKKFKNSPFSIHRIRVPHNKKDGNGSAGPAETLDAAPQTV
jgi:hypothetical protein